MFGWILDLGSWTELKKSIFGAGSAEKIFGARSVEKIFGARSAEKMFCNARLGHPFSFVSGNAGTTLGQLCCPKHEGRAIHVQKTSC